MIRRRLDPLPPWTARAGLLLFGHPRHREAVVGDLDEEFIEWVLPEAGRTEARAWYRRMAWRSLVAGWSATAGRGPEMSPESRRREQREREDVMDTLLRDVRHALRSLGRRPGFVATIVLTLALAIGANTAMFSVVHSVLLRPLPYDEADQLVAMWQSQQEAPDLRSSFSIPNFADYREQTEAFENLAHWRRARRTLTGSGAAELVTGVAISRDFFRVFRAEPVLGRSLAAEEIGPESARSVVISHAFWQNRLGADENVLERSLELDGLSHRIVGVAPEGFVYPAGAELWMGERVDVDDGCGRGCRIVAVVGRLADGRTLTSAQAEAARFAPAFEALDSNMNFEIAFNLVSLEDQAIGTVRTGLIVLLAAVAMVLLIACVNVANLLYASGLKRQGELAVRAALGASRGRLVRFMLSESLVLSLVGGLAGVLLAWLTIRGFGALAGSQLPRLDGLGLSIPVLLFALILTVDTALLFGLAPAIALSRDSVSEVINGSGRGHTGARRSIGRSSLLALQVGLSVVLLLGTGLMLRSLQELQAVDLGFDPDGVDRFTVSLPEAGYGSDEAVVFFRELTEQLSALPDVSSAAAVMGSPLGNVALGGSIARTDIPLPPRDQVPSTTIRPATVGYLRAIGIPLLRGRDFVAQDVNGGERVIIVSEMTAERLWPDEDPIGKPVFVSASAGAYPEGRKHPRTVIGIAANVRSGSLTDGDRLEVYVPHAQSGSDFMTVVMRREPGAGSALPAARVVLEDMEPDVALISPGTMRQAVADELATPRFYATILASFAGLALLLTTIGLWGVVAYQVSLRLREIGIRLAVGAERRSVVALLTRQGLVPALVGLGVGLVASAVAARVLADLLYEVRPGDPVAWASSAGLILAIAALASVFPAARASRVQPAEVLRAD